MGRKITSWNINVTWFDERTEDEDKENLYDIPDHVANVIDEWLNRVEEKEKEFIGEE